LTPFCGLEVQKTNQALQSVNNSGNTFDLISKWAITLPSLIYFSWVFIETLKPTAGCQISTLIFEIYLWREVSINIP
jgi:hypothetical protein